MVLSVECSLRSHEHLGQSSEPVEKGHTWGSAIPEQGRKRQVNSWGPLASLLSLLGEFRVSERPCLKGNDK